MLLLGPDALSGKESAGARLEPGAHPDMTIARATITIARIGTSFDFRAHSTARSPSLERRSCRTVFTLHRLSSTDAFLREALPF